MVETAEDYAALVVLALDRLSSASAGQRIMQAIESDSALLNQVGVALWWISGKTSYQPDLLTAFSTFKGRS